MRIVQPGDVIAGKYVVERIIGRGGVGIIAAARHVTLRQLVALKFLRPEIQGDPDVTHRFLREAQAAAQIRSEHVTRVMDAGALEDGTVFLVFEYLAGRDLAAVLREDGPLPVADAVDYLMQACEAIGEAHALGIVHRDIKPANLFLTVAPDGSPFVKVLDFGLSKFHHSAGTTGLTADNHVIGSPHFMSPEQMRSSREADARSDLWALGVVLFGLLTARVPFEGEFLTEVCAAVLAGKPRSLVALRPDAPRELEAVILRCLMTNPAERPQSVAELADALRPFSPTYGEARADRIARVIVGTKLALDAGSRGVTALLPAPARLEDLAGANRRGDGWRDPGAQGSSPVSWSISVGHAGSLRAGDAFPPLALDETRVASAAGASKSQPRAPASDAPSSDAPRKDSRRRLLLVAGAASLLAGMAGTFWAVRVPPPNDASGSTAAPSTSGLAAALRASGTEQPRPTPITPLPLSSAAPVVAEEHRAAPADDAPQVTPSGAPLPRAIAPAPRRPVSRPPQLRRPKPAESPPPRPASDEELILGLPH